MATHARRGIQAFEQARTGLHELERFRGNSRGRDDFPRLLRTDQQIKRPVGQPRTAGGGKTEGNIGLETFGQIEYAVVDFSHVA
jgi:hypothetical protein